jgi:hypothetical protein
VMKLNLAALRQFGKEREPNMVLREYVEVAASVDAPEGRETVAYYSIAKRADRDGFVQFDVHTSAVEKNAEALARKLGLGEKETAAMQLAAQWHDEGKTREVWQRATGKHKNGLVAKAPHINWRMLSGYRHELGSLVGAKLPDGADDRVVDLALHFIAVHHGWARPHFLPDAVDRENILRSRAVADETMLRYARLQEHYGPWGLAYLEAVFAAADALASIVEKERRAHA